MRYFIAILLGATVVFMVFSITQEWTIFEPFFLGQNENPVEEAVVPTGIEETLKKMNTLLVHLYRYKGDIRFLDRMPISGNVRQSLAEDLAYLESAGVIQDMELMSCSIESVRQVGKQTVTVLTLESWRLLYRDPKGRPFDPKPRTFDIQWRYLMKKNGGAWEVVAMEPAI
ncbi:MAG TPA: hypothetical protein PK014_03720 [Thermoanaerobaculia bacterium]|nr:hypothetical protein [Thermoanaerobaculia bacterium]HUM29116.1 hypothetical protein [Thermoanaerobaculia bacterium]HXK67493.1 hypothetical protein [Thermoanaerobaculia bacterium]